MEQITTPKEFANAIREEGLNVNSLIRPELEDSFALKPSEYFQIADSTTVPLPKSNQVNEVTVNKIRITESLKIIFKDQDQHLNSANDPFKFDHSHAPSLTSTNLENAYLEETTKVEAESVTYVRKPKSNRSKYFFQVKNHEEFYQVGKSFQEDYRKGQKFFLFANLNTPENQQKTILGIASFFQYFEQKKVLIISSQLDNSFFHSILKDAEIKELLLSNKSGPTAQFIFHNELTFLDAQSFKGNKLTSTLDYDEIFNDLNELFDCILFDLPDTLNGKNNLDLYFPIYKRADSVSFVLLRDGTSLKGMDAITQQFKSYDVKIKGAILAKQKGREIGK